MSDSELWIFGYGSLVWRPAFEHAESSAARISGFRRWFWQGSTDHRGVPGAPGRVVTVLPEAGAVCAGRVFRVESGFEAEVLAQLDQREKGGYARFVVEATLDREEESARRVSALMYAATPGNPNYLGPASTEVIARQIFASSGPSGSNIDYALELAAALRAISTEDDHVFEVERALRKLIRKEQDAEGGFKSTGL